MTVHTSSSPPVKDYGGELGLFPVNDPDPAANGWKAHFLVFASTCLFCVSVFFSASMISHSRSDVAQNQMNTDFFSEKLLEGRDMMREVLKEPEQVEELKCPSMYHLYAPTKKCLKPILRTETLHKASLSCLEEGAFVSSVSDAKEAEFTVNLFKYETEEGEVEDHVTTLEIWIGLVHVNDKWLWLDRSPVKYVDWEKGMPSKNATDKCVVVQIGLGNQWKNMDCHKRRSFVCEKAPIV